MNEKYFNIHNLLSIKICEQQNIIKNNVLYPLLYFNTTEKIGEPNITLNIGNFQPYKNKRDCYSILHKYNISNNYIYCKDKLGTVGWEYEIINIDNKQTTINFNLHSYNLKALLSCGIFAQNYLLKPIIQVKLIDIGYLPIHAAGLSYKNNGIIFIGPGGSNKTDLSTKLLHYPNFKFMGDDGIILDEQQNILSYPQYIKIFLNKMAKNKKELNIISKLNYLFNNTSLNKNDLNRYIQISSKLIIPICVIKNNSKNIQIYKISTEDAVKRIMSINELETFLSPMPSLFKFDSGWFWEVLSANSILFPDSILSKYFYTMEKRTKELMKGLTMYELQLPSILTPKVIEEIMVFIDEKTK